jgi:hypothetical protein
VPTYGGSMKELGIMISASDGNQQASLKDPLHVLVGPITRARSKMIKEAISGLIQEIWAGSKTEHSNLGPKEDEGVINLIQMGLILLN